MLTSVPRLRSRRSWPWGTPQRAVLGPKVHPGRPAFDDVGLRQGRHQHRGIAAPTDRPRERARAQPFIGRPPAVKETVPGVVGGQTSQPREQPGGVGCRGHAERRRQHL
jgi:hypothetical protein